MKSLLALLLALFMAVANAGTLRAPLAVTSNATVGSPLSIKCDVCKWALNKAFDYGCGKASGIISSLCMDFAPLCEAALEEVCHICETHCDVSNIIDDACHDVHLC